MGGGPRVLTVPLSDQIAGGARGSEGNTYCMLGTTYAFGGVQKALPGLDEDAEWLEAVAHHEHRLGST
jgi:hypothetical protein